MKQLCDILFLQTFGIILVVLGHSFYQFPSDTPFIRWIYGFHMPLFFFISGYLLKYVHGDLAHLQLSGRTGYMARKARRLLVPYVVISSLFFVPKALMSRYSVRPIQLNLHDYLDQLLIPYHNVFGAYWFMPTLFLVFTVFILARKTLGRHATTTGGVVALGALGVVDCLMPFAKDSLLNIVGVVFYLFYFALGYQYQASRVETAIKKANAAMVFITTLALSVLLMYVPQGSLTDLLMALNGILMSIGLALLYERRGAHALDHLFGYTYTIYLYSGFFQIAALQVLLHFVSLPPVVYVPLAFLMGLYGPWAMKKAWRKLRH